MKTLIRSPASSLLIKAFRDLSTMLPSGILQINRASDTATYEELLFNSLIHVHIEDLFVENFGGLTEHQWILTSSPELTIQMNTVIAGTIITTYEDFELDAVLNQNLDREETVHLILVNPTKKQVNVLSTKLYQFSRVRIALLLCHRATSGHHFIETRQFLQRFIPDRHLQRVKSHKFLYQLQVQTLRGRNYMLSVSHVEFRLTHTQGTTFLNKGTTQDETYEHAFDFIQIRVSKNIMSTTYNITTSPLPIHKMQQRHALIKAQNDPGIAETRAYILVDLTEEDREKLAAWLEELRAAHATLDPSEESEECFRFIFYKAEDPEARLHQLTFCDAISTSTKVTLAPYQHFQINDNQIIANFSNTEYEQLVYELERAGVKTMFDQHTGTMSFGIIDGTLKLAHPPGGLTYIPVTITIRQVTTGSETELVSAIVRAHSVIDFHYAHRLDDMDSHVKLHAKLPSHTNLNTIYGQHMIEGQGFYSITGPAEIQSTSWKAPFTKQERLSTIDLWAHNDRQFLETNAVASVAPYKRNDRVANRNVRLLDVRHTAEQTLVVNAPLKLKASKVIVEMTFLRNEWNNKDAQSEISMTTLHKLLAEEHKPLAARSTITDLCLEGNFSLIWNSNRHLASDLDVQGSLTIVNCKDVHIAKLNFTGDSAPNLLIVHKGPLRTKVVHKAGDSTASGAPRNNTNKQRGQDNDNTRPNSTKLDPESQDYTTQQHQKKGSKLSSLFKKMTTEQSSPKTPPTPNKHQKAEHDDKRNSKQETRATDDNPGKDEKEHEGAREPSSPTAHTNTHSPKNTTNTTDTIHENSSIPHKERTEASPTKAELTLKEKLIKQKLQQAIDSPIKSSDEDSNKRQKKAEESARDVEGQHLPPPPAPPTLTKHDNPNSACHLFVAARILAFADWRDDERNNSIDQQFIAAAVAGTKQTDHKMQGILLAFQKATGVDQYKSEDMMLSYQKLLYRLQGIERLRTKYHHEAVPYSKCMHCDHRTEREPTLTHQFYITRPLDAKETLEQLIKKALDPLEKVDSRCQKCGQGTVYEGNGIIRTANVAIVQTQALGTDWIKDNAEGLLAIIAGRTATKLQTPLITADAGSMYTHASCIAVVYLDAQHYWIKEQHTTEQEDVYYDPLIGNITLTHPSWQRIQERSKPTRIHSIVIRFARNREWKVPNYISKSHKSPAFSSITSTTGKANKLNSGGTAAPYRGGPPKESPIAARTRQKEQQPVVDRSRRNYILISLFDGANTAYSTLQEDFGPPRAALLAEHDVRTRVLTASMHGIRADSQAWQVNTSGVPVLYAEDAWDHLHEKAKILQELLTFAEENTEIIIIAGSPCQDVTTYGQYRGLLGFAGSRSRHMHAFYFTLKALQALWPLTQTFYVLENSGSMQDMHLKYITKLLNVTPQCVKKINASLWTETARSRLFFSPTTSCLLPTRSPKPWHNGWDKLILNEQNKPMPTYMLTRGRCQLGYLVRSTIAYHPHNLLYEVDFFKDILDNKDKKTRIEQLLSRATQLVPTQYSESWASLLSWGSGRTETLRPTKKHDEAARDLASLLGNPNLSLPFRLPTEEEMIRDSNMKHLQSCASMRSKDILDAIGNCFYPDALRASYTTNNGLGLREKLIAKADIETIPPLSIGEARAAFEELKQNIVANAKGQNLKDEIQHKLAPETFPTDMQELGTEQFYEALRQQRVKRPDILPVSEIENPTSEDESSNHKPILRQENKAVTIAHATFSLLKVSVQTLVANAKYTRNHSFDAHNLVNGPNTTIHTWKAEVQEALRKRCYQEATMYLVIHTEENCEHAQDNIYLIYPTYFKRVQICLIDMYKVMQSTIAICHRSADGAAKRLHDIADILRDLPNHYVTVSEPCEEVESTRIDLLRPTRTYAVPYIEIHEATLLCASTGTEICFGKGRVGAVSTREETLKKLILPTAESSEAVWSLMQTALQQDILPDTLSNILDDKTLRQLFYLQQEPDTALVAIVLVELKGEQSNEATRVFAQVTSALAEEKSALAAIRSFHRKLFIEQNLIAYSTAAKATYKARSQRWKAEGEPHPSIHKTLFIYHNEEYVIGLRSLQHTNPHPDVVMIT